MPLAALPINLGVERRQSPRYRLVVPVFGAIEHCRERHLGRVLDVSLTGFSILLPLSLSKDITVHGQNDLGEISNNGKFYGGFGRIVRAVPTVGGVSIGFCWDKDMHSSHTDQIANLIEGINQSKAEAIVSSDESSVFLSGHVSSAVTRDVYDLINGNRKSVVLMKCTSIDSSGLDMLFCIKEAGYAVVNQSDGLQHVLDRFDRFNQPTGQTRVRNFVAKGSGLRMESE